jgi:hypothetical protein
MEFVLDVLKVLISLMVNVLLLVLYVKHMIIILEIVCHVLMDISYKDQHVFYPLHQSIKEAIIVEIGQTEDVINAREDFT